MYKMRILDLVDELEKEYKELSVELESYVQSINPHLQYCDVRRTWNYARGGKYRDDMDLYFRLVASLEACKGTLMSLRRGLAKGDLIKCESEEIGAMGAGAVSSEVEEKHGNLTDVGGEQESEAIVGILPYNSTLTGTSLELSEFFERPVQIGAFDLPLNTDFDLTLQPWLLWSENPSIRAKLRNYAFFKGELHVRFNLSGTMFHFGRVQIAYHPGDVACAVATAYRSAPALRQNFLKWKSQLRSCKTMNVSDNMPLTMDIPFIAPQPMLRLFNNAATVIATGTDFDDFTTMGWLYISALNSIQSVSDTPTDLSLEVYAWMTNVSLGCITGTQISITTESKEYSVFPTIKCESDERKSGPIERVATRTSAILDALTTVPYVGPYAIASSMISRGIGNLAALFGWSVPNMYVQPGRMRNDAFQNAANVIGYDTGKRITLDPKQEITVDPRSCGSIEDEMSISYINSIDSLLDQFTWPSAATPLQAPIWNCMVTPRANTVTAFGGGFVTQPSALGFAAAPFFWWRGDIIYRFEIVCSKFHRGKLAVYFEPNVSQEVIIDANLETNKQFIYIVDLQETQEFEICVNWAFPRPWAQVCGDLLSRHAVGSEFTTPTQFWDFANGYIGVTPLTALQSPTADDITINVYIRSDNMVYNEFHQTALPGAALFTESISVKAESKDLSSVMPVSCHELNPLPNSMANICENHFGEMPVSFRSLLKRFWWGTNLVETVPDTGIWQAVVTDTMWPVLAPTLDIDAPGIVSDLYSYLRYAYMGIRGGIKKRVALVSIGRYEPMTTCMVQTLAPTVTPLSNNMAFVDTSQYIHPDLHGMVLYVPSTQGGIEFELPNYSTALYGYAQQDPPFAYGGVDVLFPKYSQENFTVVLDINPFTDTDVVDYRCMNAAAEDFNLMYFYAAPPRQL